MRVITTLLALTALAGCTTTSTPENYFARNDIMQPTVQSFPHCRGYGCAKIDTVTESAVDWPRIKALFPAKDAATERASIAKAIGFFEQSVGAATRTDEDVAGTYVHPGPYQLDCIDESTNTTVFLSLLDQKKLLKFHTVGAPQTRVPFFLGVFVSHRTATVTDTATGIKYAVDSWFHDNGVAAEIVDIDTWKNRWHPPTAKN